MGRKYTIFGVKYQNIFVGRHPLNYKEMFVGTPIYTSYAVITIAMFTSMLAIELFYITQLCSFLGYFLEYLTIFIPYNFAFYP